MSVGFKWFRWVSSGERAKGRRETDRLALSHYGGDGTAVLHDWEEVERELEEIIGS
jgi:hypothetical protein